MGSGEPRKRRTRPGPIEGTLLREFDPETDTGFIVGTWLASFRDSDQARSISDQRYKRLYRFVIGELLQGSHVVMVCDEEDQEKLIGYMVCQPGVVHYVYVKQLYRALGIMTSLLESHGFGTEVEFDITFAPWSWKKLRKVYAKASYRPELLESVVAACAEEKKFEDRAESRRGPEEEIPQS